MGPLSTKTGEISNPQRQWRDSRAHLGWMSLKRRIACHFFDQVQLVRKGSLRMIKRMRSRRPPSVVSSSAKSESIAGRSPTSISRPRAYIKSFSVKQRANSPSLCKSCCRNSGTVEKGFPPGSCPVALTGRFLAYWSRQPPIASKFSTANPSGSILRWHSAQLASARCFSSCSRIVIAPRMSGSMAGTSGGGEGG